jgi:hypothetical protein
MVARQLEGNADSLFLKPKTASDKEKAHFLNSHCFIAPNTQNNISAHKPSQCFSTKIPRL